MSIHLALALTMMTSAALFDDTEVHEIWIHINSRDYAQLLERYDQNTYYPCDIEWQGQRVFNVGIRSRGNATRNQVKPGFHLDFNRYVRGQRFLGLKALVLDNQWHDPSMMKERLSMPLFRRMGLPAPRESYARVYIGRARTYAGLYAIVENIDEPFLEQHFGENDGYLFEYDRIDGYHFEDLGPSLDPFAARFKPKTHEMASAFELYDPIQQLVRVINDTRPEDLGPALEPFLDLDRFLAFIAVENYLAEWDGFAGDLGMANFYWYRFAGTLRSELLPWDQDQTFTTLDFPPWHNLELNVLTRKIWAEPGLRARYLQTLLEVAKADEGWLEEEALRQYALIRPSVYADTLKYQTNDEFESAAEFVVTFARDRRAWVRRAVADLVNSAAGR